MQRTIPALALGLFLAACGDDASDNAIVGKWESESPDAVIEYREDGSLVLTADGQPVDGTWEVEDDEVTMTLTAPSGETRSFTCLYTIDADLLTISEGDEMCEEIALNRVE